MTSLNLVYRVISVGQFRFAIQLILWHQMQLVMVKIYKIEIIHKSVYSIDMLDW